VVRLWAAVNSVLSLEKVGLVLSVGRRGGGESAFVVGRERDDCGADGGACGSSCENVGNIEEN
jgi:hypothetical protein